MSSEQDRAIETAKAVISSVPGGAGWYGRIWTAIAIALLRAEARGYERALAGDYHPARDARALNAAADALAEESGS